MAESFLQLLKRERIRRKVYVDREEARRDVFDCIEMFYNQKQRHGYNNRLLPVEFERLYSSGSIVSSKTGVIQTCPNATIYLNTYCQPQLS